MTKDEALKMAHKTFMQLNERHPRRDNGDGCFDKELKAINEALEQPLTRDWKETIDERIAKDDAFKQALEQPAQEPVAWIHNGELYWEKQCKFFSRDIGQEYKGQIPLYTHPAPVCKCGER